MSPYQGRSTLALKRQRWDAVNKCGVQATSINSRFRTCAVNTVHLALRDSSPDQAAQGTHTAQITVCYISQAGGWTLARTVLQNRRQGHALKFDDRRLPSLWFLFISHKASVSFLHLFCSSYYRDWSVWSFFPLLAAFQRHSKNRGRRLKPDTLSCHSVKPLLSPVYWLTYPQQDAATARQQNKLV